MIEIYIDTKKIISWIILRYIIIFIRLNLIKAFIFKNNINYKL